MKKLFALLLAVAMLLTLTACGDKKEDDGVANKPEDVAEEFVKGMMNSDFNRIFNLYAFDYEEALQGESLEYYDDKEAFFEEMSDQYDEEITSWSQLYQIAKQETKAELEEDFGKGYKITVKAGDVVDMGDEDLDELIDEVDDDYGDYTSMRDLKDAEEGKIVTVIITIKGEDEDGEDVEEEKTYEIYMLKMNGKWKVADYSYIYNDEY